jgi:hypothetical protein
MGQICFINNPPRVQHKTSQTNGTFEVKISSTMTQFGRRDAGYQDTKR